MKSIHVAIGALALTTLSVAAVLPTPFVQEMPQPTEEHKSILSSVGEWEGTMTSYMPGMPETPIPATEKIEALGDFWTQVRFECEFMGMPYTGSGCVGYDAAKKKYVGTWIDNMSSTLAVMEGEMDPAKKALVMRWMSPDMMGQMAPHRSEMVRTENSYTSTFYVGEGEGTRSMVISMKRKPKKAMEAGAK